MAAGAVVQAVSGKEVAAEQTPRALLRTLSLNTISKRLNQLHQFLNGTNLSGASTGNVDGKSPFKRSNDHIGIETLQCIHH